MKIVQDNDEVPFIYLWIYKKFCDNYGCVNCIISYNNCIETLRRTIHQVPKKYNLCVLKELQAYGFLEKINKNQYKLLGSNSKSKLKKLDYTFW